MSNPPVVALTAEQKRTVLHSLLLRFLDRAGIEYHLEDTQTVLSIHVDLTDSPSSDDPHGHAWKAMHAQ